jgi:dTDP-4-amino-4,6-dideoxygalactose transaminase
MLPWKLIPRYHPQVRIFDILASLLASPRDVVMPEGLIPASEGDNAFYFNSGTTALVVALRSLKLPPGSGVGVPTYCCVTVFEAVAAVGHRCVFLDIRADDFQLDMDSLREKRPEISAMILVHTFGCPADFEAVHAIFGNCPIIEDCAHALGSGDSHGVPLGMRAVASVFSFNLNKPVSAGAGGLLRINYVRLIPEVRAIVESLARPLGRPSWRKIASRLLSSVAYRKPWYGLMAWMKLLRLRRSGALEGKVDLGRMNLFDRALLRRRFENAPQQFAIQRSLAAKYAKACESWIPPRQFSAVGQNGNGYLWPMMAQNAAEKEKAMDFFHARGVDAFLLWPECLQTAGRFGYVKGTCPNLEQNLERLFFLPLYAELNEKDSMTIMSAIREWIRLQHQDGRQ